MDFWVAGKDGVAPIVSVDDAGTVLIPISADLLAYYQRLDSAVRAFLTQSQIDAIKGGAARTAPEPSA